MINNFAILFTNNLQTAPSDSDFYIFPICPDDLIYRRNQQEVQYFNYTTLNAGLPTIQFHWQNNPMPIGTFNDIRTLYNNHKYYPYNARCWFYWFNPALGAYMLSAGVMQDPEQDNFGYGGDYAQGFKLTFSRVGMEYNVQLPLHTFDKFVANVGSYTYVVGDSDFEDNSTSGQWYY